MICSITPLSKSVQRQTCDFVNEMHSLTLTCDWNDNALRILVTTLFECIECKSKFSNEALGCRIANNASNLFANSCFYVSKSWC